MPGPPSPPPLRVQRMAEAPTGHPLAGPCACSALKRRWPTQKLSPPATGLVCLPPRRWPAVGCSTMGTQRRGASSSGSAQRQAGRRAPVPASGASGTRGISRKLEAQVSQCH